MAGHTGQGWTTRSRPVETNGPMTGELPGWGPARPGRRDRWKNAGREGHPLRPGRPGVSGLVGRDRRARASHRRVGPHRGVGRRDLWKRPPPVRPSGRRGLPDPDVDRHPALRPRARDRRGRHRGRPGQPVVGRRPGGGRPHPALRRPGHRPAVCQLRAGVGPPAVSSSTVGSSLPDGRSASPTDSAEGGASRWWLTRPWCTWSPRGYPTGRPACTSPSPSPSTAWDAVRRTRAIPSSSWGEGSSGWPHSSLCVRSSPTTTSPCWCVTPTRLTLPWPAVPPMWSKVRGRRPSNSCPPSSGPGPSDRETTGCWSAVIPTWSRRPAAPVP